jgi:hypothetical protein
MVRICGNVENIYEKIHVSMHAFKGVRGERSEEGIYFLPIEKALDLIYG